MSRMGAVLHPAYSGTIYPQQVRVPSPVSLCSLRRSPGALDSEPTTSGPPITRTVACFIQAPVVCSSTTCRQCWLQLCVSCTVSSHRRCCDCTASSAPRLQISRHDSTRRLGRRCCCCCCCAEAPAADNAATRDYYIARTDSRTDGWTDIRPLHRRVPAAHTTQAKSRNSWSTRYCCRNS